MNVVNLSSQLDSAGESPTAEDILQQRGQPLQEHENNTDQHENLGSVGCGRYCLVTSTHSFVVVTMIMEMMAWKL
jgi:hypothetical protein